MLLEGGGQVIVGKEEDVLPPGLTGGIQGPYEGLSFSFVIFFPFSGSYKFSTTFCQQV